MTTKDNQKLVEIEKAIVLSVQDRQQMKEEVKEIKGEMKEIKGDVKGFDAKLDALLDKMENKFAPKWTCRSFESRDEVSQTFLFSF